MYLHVPPRAHAIIFGPTYIISIRCSSLVSAEMTEALILELLLMTGLLIVRHWSRIHAPTPAR